MSQPHDVVHMPPPEERAAALERVMKTKALVTDKFIDDVAGVMSDLGPMNGARLVAKAWVDSEFRQRLLDDAKSAAAELGIGGPEGELVAIVNTDGLHNVVVCTLCSCYPWAVLGLPPNWYKSPAYRARMVREPRRLLGEMGLDLPDDVEVHVWDSSAEKRFMVVPQRPAGTEDLDADALAALVTRDGMIGVAAL
jgi:nitrile hydratase